MDVKGRKVTVIGLGNSGYNAAALLLENGAIVSVTDSGDSAEVVRQAGELLKKGARVETGVHTRSFIEEAWLVVLSPGVDDNSPAVKWADGRGIPVISELELGYLFCKGRILAITGTNGKTTTTSLVGQILEDAGLDTVVCGNIGNSLCGEIGRVSEKTWVVLEVSSFQLERTKSFRADIAVILNITDDHMDRYVKFDDYYREKLKIFANQKKGDVLILNHDAVNLRPIKDAPYSKVLFFSRTAPVFGAYAKGDTMILSVSGKEEDFGLFSGVSLKGLHNLENILAAALAASCAGAGIGTMAGTVKAFKGLPHRFETVEVVDGVEFIDDSKGTTVDSTARALESCQRPVILIAGGKDKNSDYTSIRETAARHLSGIVLIGEAGERIRRSLEGVAPAHKARDMEDAVAISKKMAKPGTVVLMSPMCSSFDMFKNYKERGEVFARAVRKLEGVRG